MGENHKSTEVNESNIYDISINGIDLIDVGKFESFLVEFWKLRPLSRELLYFWAMEHRTVDEISRLIGRKRVEILAQLVDIRANFFQERPMLIRDAVQQLVHSFSVPEEEIESLYQSQKVGPKRSTFLNIVFFF